MADKEVWLASTDEEFWSNSVQYESKEEALAKAGNDHALEPGQTFWVGKVGKYEPVVDADAVIERLAEKALDACDEHAECWMDTVPGEQIVELEKALTETWARWADKHSHWPTFFPMADVTEHKWEDGLPT